MKDMMERLEKFFNQFERELPMDMGAIAVKHLGPVGTMISASKSTYRDRFPAHVVVFNGNVCTEEHGKIWFGDLDVTKSQKKLRALAEELGCTVFVLREMDGRFQNEHKPLLENAVATIQI